MEVWIREGVCILNSADYKKWERAGDQHKTDESKQNHRRNKSPTTPVGECSRKNREKVCKDSTGKYYIIGEVRRTESTGEQTMRNWINSVQGQT